MTGRRRWGYFNRRICCNDCPSTSVIRDAQQWRHRLTCPFLEVAFQDLRGFPLRRLPPTVSRSMIYGSVSWQQTWPNHDSVWRLTAKAPDVQRGYWPVAINTRSFYALWRPMKCQELLWPSKIDTSKKCQQAITKSTIKFNCMLWVITNIYLLCSKKNSNKIRRRKEISESRV